MANPARPGLGIRHTDDHVIDPPDGKVVFSYMARQRIRRTSQEVHSLVVDRLRYATRQGAAASPTQLVGEIQELHRAILSKRGLHGPALNATQERVRVHYLELAASCLILAERETRPPELKRGKKSSTDAYQAPDFSVPKQ